MTRESIVACLIVACAALFTTVADAKPLKIYILVGQSNMQGQARLSSFAGMAMDPNAKPLYDKIMDASGQPREQDNVYIVGFSQNRATDGTFVDVEKSGKLTFGYGGAVDPEKAGPELGFGVTMYDNLHEPILLIKTSWGGKSLKLDFRPPSGGPYYEHPELVKDRKTNKGVLITAAEQLEKTKEASGRYYRLMLKEVQQVLADPGKYCPAYDPKDGYEIAGFVWFQGFNDLVGDYPNANPNDPQRGAPRDYSEYSRLLACFIRDVRKDLSAPNMPFVIGVLGVGGKNAGGNTDAFRKAMAAPAAMDEFKGNVRAVNTADYWDEKLGELDNRRQLARENPNSKNIKDDQYSDLRKKLAPFLKELATLEEQPKTNQTRSEITDLNEKIQNTLFTPEELDYIAKNRSQQGYHYLGSAKTYSQIGEAFAKALFKMNE